MSMKPILRRTPAEETLVARAAEAETGAGPLRDLRRAAAERFAERGLPHRRVEAYKYTDLKKLVREVPPIAVRPDDGTAAAALGHTPGWDDAARCRLVLVDGYFVAALSDEVPEGVSVAALAEALATGHPLVERIGTIAGPVDDPAIGLNTAFMQDGVLIEIAAGATVTTTLEIVHRVSGETPVACYPRNFVLAGEGAKARVIETFSGPDASGYHVDSATELLLSDGADIAWIKRQQEGSEALHLSSLAIGVGAEARFDYTAFMGGGSVARAQVFIGFAGEGASADLRGVTLVRGRQHADTTLVCDHVAPGCVSTEVFKTVLGDEAKGIFQGQIVVRPGAQKTDARMMARALLLSEDADAISKPELEIYADDVQCAHGSTAGEIDDEALFYLMARGIPRDRATAMLVSAYLAEVISAIDDETLAGALLREADNWLEQKEED